MKKILVFVMVLSLASMVHAGILLGVDGEYDVETITVAPSDYLTLSIKVDGPETPTVNPATGMPTNGGTLLAGGNIKVRIRNASTGAILDDSGVTFPSVHTTLDDVVPTVKLSGTEGTFSVGIAYWEVPWSVFDSENDYVNITGGNQNNNTIGTYILMDDLEFHCEEAGDVYVDLVASGTGGIVYYTWTVTGDEMMGYTAEVDEIINLYEYNDTIATVLVHQVPEPMTIALLGLGGLFLRRRR